MFICESITKITKGVERSKVKGKKMSQPHIKYLPYNFINHLGLQHKCRISHVSILIYKQIRFDCTSNARLSLLYWTTPSKFPARLENRLEPSTYCDVSKGSHKLKVKAFKFNFHMISWSSNTVNETKMMCFIYCSTIKKNCFPEIIIMFKSHWN